MHGRQPKVGANVSCRVVKLHRAVGVTTHKLAGLGQFHPEINPLGILPNATFGGVPNAINLATEVKFPFIGRNNIWNYTDNLSAIRGAHALKFGVYFEPTSRNARFQTQFTRAVR